MELRGKIDKVKQTLATKLEPLTTAKQALEDEIKAEMIDSGQKSARFQLATISLAVRPSIKIVDYSKLVKDIQKKGLANEYLELTPNTLFKNAVKETIKTGKLFKGTELHETEFLSVRKPEDPKKERRKVVNE